MNNLKYGLLSFAFIVLAINNLIAQSNKAKEIDLLMNKVSQSGIFNGNILVVENGKIIYQSAFGYSEADKKTKLTLDYRFNIGSIAKEFNAVGIMMLKEQDKLNLDDKVSKYLTYLPSWADKISIKNLLQYTSGLPDINWKTVKNDTDILNDLKALKELDFDPGTKYAYNNSNVFLQRRIIEKITGISFQKFVETKMLKPCKMTESGVDLDLRGKKVAISFNDSFVEDPRQFANPMSGWTSVTTKDLYKWTQCLHDFRLINKSSFKEILLPTLPNRQSGLGAGSMEGDQIREHWHDGSSIDFQALMYTAPSEEISIILMTNSAANKLYEIKDVIKLILSGATVYKVPKRSIFSVLLKKIDNLSTEEIIKLYDEIKIKQSDSVEFNTESDFNQIAYVLMGKKRLDEAIKFFELNVKLFPNSSNAYDSLGEAYFNKGDKKNALINYKKSFELDSKNLNAKEIIDKLEKEN